MDDELQSETAVLQESSSDSRFHPEPPMHAVFWRYLCLLLGLEN